MRIDIDTERINDVYSYLLYHKIVRSKTDFAEQLELQRSNLTNMMNGKLKLPDDIWAKIATTYPGVFAGEWLLTGHGKMLLEDEKHSAPQPEPRSIEEVEQKAQLSIVELAATLIKEQESLRRQLTDTLYEVRTLRNEMARDRDTIKDLREALSTLLFKREETSLPLAAESHDLPKNSPKH